MYYGKMTKELEDLVEQYEQLFGVDPCGEEEFEIVKNKKDIFYYWDIDDDDDDF